MHRASAWTRQVLLSVVAVFFSFCRTWRTRLWPQTSGWNSHGTTTSCAGNPKSTEEYTCSTCPRITSGGRTLCFTTSESFYISLQRIRCTSLAAAFLSGCQHTLKYTAIFRFINKLSRITRVNRTVKNTTTIVIYKVLVYTNISTNYMLRPLLFRPFSGWIP